MRPVSSVLVYMSSSNAYYNMPQLKPQLYLNLLLLFITIIDYNLKCIEIGSC